MCLIFQMLDIAEHNAWQFHKTQHEKLEYLIFTRIVLIILKGNQRKFVTKSKPSSLKYLDLLYDCMDHLIVQQEQESC